MWLSYSEPNTRVTKSSKTYTSNTSDSKIYSSNSSENYGKTTIKREYNLSPITTTETTTRQSRARNRSPTYEKNIETKVTRDVSYESEPIVDNFVSSSSTINRSYNNYNKNAKSVEQQVVPYNEVNSNNLKNELNDLPLSGNILPGPGTKVTTTVS